METVLTETTRQHGVGKAMTGSQIGDRMYAHTITGFDFTKLVDAGQIEGLKIINKFGMNAVLSTTREDVHSQGGLLAHPTVAGKVKLKSSVAGDNQGGLGTQSVYMAGVDGDYNFVEETVLMHATDGTILGPESVNDYMFVYLMRSIRRGTLLGYNLGNIDAEFTSDAGTSICQMPVTLLGIGNGSSMTTHYVVPAGKIAFVNTITSNIETSKIVDYGFHILGPPTSLTIPPYDGVNFLPLFRRNDSGITHTDASDYSYFLPEKYHIWASAKVTVGTAFIFINYEILEMDAFSA